MERKKIATIGDAMIVFNPTKTGPLRFVPSFDRAVGGAELNFAIGMSRLGVDSKWISCIGDDEFGKVIYNFARGEGIDVSNVKTTKEIPTSVYFKEIRENGEGKSFYYRNPSPLLKLTVKDIETSVLEDIDALHVSGVFLAICEHNIETIIKLLKIAKQKNIIVSFDPNLRLKLWTLEQAKKVFEQIYMYVDYLLIGDTEFSLLFDDTSPEYFIQIYKMKEVVIKKGELGAIVYTATEKIEGAAFNIKAVDTVGAGDAFDAAYMYGILNQKSTEKCLKLANGAGALVATIKGDNEGLPTLLELESFIGDEFIIER